MMQSTPECNAAAGSPKFAGHGGYVSFGNDMEALCQWQPVFSCRCSKQVEILPMLSFLVCKYWQTIPYMHSARNKGACAETSPYSLFTGYSWWTFPVSFQAIYASFIHIVFVKRYFHTVMYDRAIWNSKVSTEPQRYCNQIMIYWANFLMQMWLTFAHQHHIMLSKSAGVILE